MRLGSPNRAEWPGQAGHPTASIHRERTTPESRFAYVLRLVSRSRMMSLADPISPACRTGAGTARIAWGDAVQGQRSRVARPGDLAKPSCLAGMAASTEIDPPSRHPSSGASLRTGDGSCSPGAAELRARGAARGRARPREGRGACCGKSGARLARIVHAVAAWKDPRVPGRHCLRGFPATRKPFCAHPNYDRLLGLAGPPRTLAGRTAHRDALSAITIAFRVPVLRENPMSRN